MKEFIKFIIFVIITIYLGICLISCSPTKKATTTENKKTETLVIRDTVIIKVSDSTSVKKDETRKTDESSLIFNVPNDMSRYTIYGDTNIVYGVPTAPCPDNKIIYRNNGDIEVSGAIKEFKRNETLLQQKYDSLRVHNEEEKASRFYWQNLAEENKKETSIKKHSGVKIFFFGFILGAILMFLLLFWLNKKKSLTRYI